MNSLKRLFNLPIWIAIAIAISYFGIMFFLAYFVNITAFLVYLFTSVGIVCGYEYGHNRGKSAGFKEGLHYLDDKERQIERLKKHLTEKEVDDLLKLSALELTYVHQGMMPDEAKRQAEIDMTMYLKHNNQKEAKPPN